MVLDLTQSKRTDTDLVQEIVLPYMLLIAMGDIPKDDGGKLEAHPGRLILLKGEATNSLMNLSKTKQRVISKRVGRIKQNVIKKANPVNSYKELSIAISMAVLDLVKQNKIVGTNTQTISLCIELLEEALEYGGWGNFKIARAASNNIIKALHDNNCFKKELHSGLDIKP